MVELLEELKSTVRDFGTREERVNHDLTVKLAKERRWNEEALQAQASQLAEDLASEDAKYRAAKEASETRYEQRKGRISRAHRSSKDHAMSATENETGSRKYVLQKKLMQLERDHDDGLDQTKKNFEEFSNNLAQELASLDELEKTARNSFSGYRGFVRLLLRAQKNIKVDQNRDEHQLLDEMRTLLGKANTDLKRFGGFILPLLFRFLPVWLLLIASLAPALLQHFGVIHISQTEGIGYTAGAIVLVLVLYFMGKQRAKPLAATIANALGRARTLHSVCLEKSENTYSQEMSRVETEFKEGRGAVDKEYKSAIREDERLRVSRAQEVDQRKLEASARNMALRRMNLERLERAHQATGERLNNEAEAAKKKLAASLVEKETRHNAEHCAHWENLESEWKTKVQPIYDAIGAANKLAEKVSPPWSPKVVETWTPPIEFSQAAEFAHFEVEVEKLAEVTPKDTRLALPGPARFSAPLFLTYPNHGSILFETSESGRDDIIGALNNITLRLLSNAPAGKANFTIIDPVGLGKNFSGLMHLADYEDRIINNRIWTQPAQIEEKLAELNEHMEKIIQMYLRNEYETIAEYNAQAGNMAEKYHFLVIADFPVNFGEIAIKRLLSIAASGARCGVYTLIHWDQRQPAPHNFVADELRKHSTCITRRANDCVLQNRSIPGAKLVLDAPPATELATDLIHKIGKSSKDSSRIEVPFSQVAPSETEIWSEDTTSELQVPIGRTGATKLQYLAIGKGTRQHALVAGKTGSGKSTLFHVIITNLALWCSPDQVEFYLIDFKKGVEFKCYAANRLPHARVVAIESDREFGLSVLQRVDDELRRRGDLFRKLGAQDIAGYKKAGGTEPMPRSLLMIDEFQELFVEEDRVSQSASVLLDRIVRQGRAFGIHVILGSQTLGGAYTVARTTLGQMVIRIALQCNEADAYLIMDDSNPAPRLLSRPGEGIYNDAAGALEGNSPFQAVWISDDDRDHHLERVRERADRSNKRYPDPIVFEGNTPGSVRENPLLRDLLEAENITRTRTARIWLGSPNAIKGPTEVVFEKQSGNNLLIVGQREEATLSILSVGLVALAAQYPAGAVRIFVFSGNPPESPEREFLERIIQAIPHKITLVKNTEVAQIMNELATDMKKRAEDEQSAHGPDTFLIFHDLQKFTKLRYEEDFSFSASEETTANPSMQLNNIVSEGSSLGFHVIASCDSYNNVNRFFSRKALTGFEMRVLFQMSANDSASLIDSPKASTLGLHRALYYNEQQGYMEVFRPYALPDNGWIEDAGTKLGKILKLK
ncbi:cell divisionFtsK/SpoIIIE [Pedosphaera parvula Ellin514]|uniref:Cell divisionFtsK/SpoIIIE n=2 Tax=Pedosphaera TaxID=1032526 RepID=B9XIJ9_PEDPL|nr:cell divisionFtsK/SpoIIIE [Pedosphaera parvula Ellin514]